jgi:hypothetical protein
MKLVRLARNVILARLAWRYIARRRALVQQRRARRMMIAPVVIAGGAGAIWAARRRILAGARRGLEVATPAAAQPAGEPPGESLPSPRTPEPAESRMRGDGNTPPREPSKKSTAGTKAHRDPMPSPKKRRRRARQQRAEQREKAARESAHGGKVKVEIDENPELRAPLGDLKH